jgi:hypothetical protein
MQYIFYLSIIIYLFLTSSVASQIGIETVSTYSSLLMVLLFFVEFLKKHFLFFATKFNQEFKIILLGLFIIFWEFLLNQTDQIKNVIDFFIIPMGLSILLSQQNDKHKKIVFYIILIFFGTECFIGIVESILKINFFVENTSVSDGLNLLDDKSEIGFRSTALLGHPLHNALCVSIIMGFILTTPLNNIKKLMFVFSGFIALLCFNARGATLLWIFLIILFIIVQFFDKTNKKTNKIFLLSLVFLALLLISILVTNYGLGDRLINDGIYDGSAQTRTNVFSAFNYINNQDLWYGNAKNYTYVMNMLGAGGVENSYIVIIMRHGILLSVFIFILYYFFIAKKIKNHLLFNKIIIFISFILVGSMNNSLAIVTPWSIFIICVSVFPKQKKEAQKTKTPIYISR